MKTVLLINELKFRNTLSTNYKNVGRYQMYKKNYNKEVSLSVNRKSKD